MSLKVGDIVHIVTEHGDRPAICVRAWNDNCGNFQMFIDGCNDYGYKENSNSFTREQCDAGIVWMTSVPYSDNQDIRTWHEID